jgi:hypothetical protein
MKYAPKTKKMTKRQGGKRGKKPKPHKKPPSDMRKEAGINYGDIIKKVAGKKAEGML